MAKTKEEIDAEWNAYEDEHCAHLAEIGRLAKEHGYQVGTGEPPPELNPDGSYVDKDLEVLTDADDEDDDD